jgi:RNA polymerase sigma factor (TIGR02999 family)
MRQVLVDHARSKGREKRGGGAGKADIQIETLADSAEQPGGVNWASREMRVLELDELLSRLARDDQRAARVAELRLFGGMEQEQIARVLGVSRKTVTNDWAFARAWLTDQYRGDRADA